MAIRFINFTTYNYDRTQQLQQAPNLLSATDQLMDLTNQLGMSELIQQKSLLPLSMPFDVFQQPGTKYTSILTLLKYNLRSIQIATEFIIIKLVHNLY